MQPGDALGPQVQVHHQQVRAGLLDVLGGREFTQECDVHAVESQQISEQCEQLGRIVNHGQAMWPASMDHLDRDSPRTDRSPTVPEPPLCRL